MKDFINSQRFYFPEKRKKIKLLFMQEIEHFFAPFYLTKNNIFLFAFEKMELRFIAKKK